MYDGVPKTWNLPHKTFKAVFDITLYGHLAGFGNCRIKRPKDDVFNHMERVFSERGREKKYAEGCAINERKLYPPKRGAARLRLSRLGDRGGGSRGSMTNVSLSERKKRR